MKTLILVLACAIQALPAAAQVKKTAPAPKVAVEIKALREVKVKKDGKETVRLEPVEKAKSGEVMLYSVAYRNEGDAPAKNAVITDPLPKGVICLSKTAVSAGAETEFSFDGAATWAKLPLVKKERTADGKMEEKPVPDSAITHVRWTLKKDLPPGASGEIIFKVKVK
jgi:uncharacterized repeat protein (TIGR01451 family)